MAKPKLYQRLRTAGFPWVPLRNKVHPQASMFGVRCTLDGKRRLETFAALEEAKEALKQRTVAIVAHKTGVAVPGFATPSRGTKTPVGVAVETYFANLANRGLDPKSIKTYRVAVEQFVTTFKKAAIEDASKQDMLDFMGWLRKQPVPKRKHGNPERTMANKCSHVAIFLKAFGVSGLLKKNEYPSYEEKTVSAHPDDELDFLYSHANGEQRFLLDYFLGTCVRDGEAAHAEYTDVKGNILEIKRKPHLNWHPKKNHCRKITLPQSLAESIRAREKGSDSPLIFPNGGGKPNQHLLRELQDLAAKAGAKFHTELHKLRKTGATRWAVAGIPVHVIQKLLGHKSLETTQRYLADVDLSSGNLNKAVEEAAYRSKPKLIAAKST